MNYQGSCHCGQIRYEWKARWKKAVEQQARVRAANASHFEAPAHPRARVIYFNQLADR